MLPAKESNRFSELSSNSQVQPAFFCLTCVCTGTSLAVSCISYILRKSFALFHKAGCVKILQKLLQKGKEHFVSVSQRWHAWASRTGNHFHAGIHYCTSCLNFPLTFQLRLFPSACKNLEACKAQLRYTSSGSLNNTFCCISYC